MDFLNPTTILTAFVVALLAWGLKKLAALSEGFIQHRTHMEAMTDRWDSFMADGQVSREKVNVAISQGSERLASVEKNVEHITKWRPWGHYLPHFEEAVKYRIESLEEHVGIHRVPWPKREAPELKRDP